MLGSVLVGGLNANADLPPPIPAIPPEYDEPMEAWESVILVDDAGSRMVTVPNAFSIRSAHGRAEKVGSSWRFADFQVIVTYERVEGSTHYNAVRYNKSVEYAYGQTQSTNPPSCKLQPGGEIAWVAMPNYVDLVWSTVHGRWFACVPSFPFWIETGPPDTPHGSDFLASSEDETNANLNGHRLYAWQMCDGTYGTPDFNDNGGIWQLNLASSNILDPAPFWSHGGCNGTTEPTEQSDPWANPFENPDVPFADPGVQDEMYNAGDPEAPYTAPMPNWAKPDNHDEDDFTFTTPGPWGVGDVTDDLETHATTAKDTSGIGAAWMDALGSPATELDNTPPKWEWVFTVPLIGDLPIVLDFENATLATFVALGKSLILASVVVACLFMCWRVVRGA